jgi:hypothetical protein
VIITEGEKDGGVKMTGCPGNDSNCGEKWFRQGDSAMIPNMDLYGIGVVDTKTAWAVGVDETLLKTVDGGMNWKVQTTSVTIPGPQVRGSVRSRRIHSSGFIIHGGLSGKSMIPSFTFEGGIMGTQKGNPPAPCCLYCGVLTIYIALTGTF